MDGSNRDKCDVEEDSDAERQIPDKSPLVFSRGNGHGVPLGASGRNHPPGGTFLKAGTAIPSGTVLPLEVHPPCGFPFCLAEPCSRLDCPSPRASSHLAPRASPTFRFSVFPHSGQ